MGSWSAVAALGRQVMGLKPHDRRLNATSVKEYVLKEGNPQCSYLYAFKNKRLGSYFASDRLFVTASSHRCLFAAGMIYIIYI